MPDDEKNGDFDTNRQPVHPGAAKAEETAGTTGTETD